MHQQKLHLKSRTAQHQREQYLTIYSLSETIATFTKKKTFSTDYKLIEKRLLIK